MAPSASNPLTLPLRLGAIRPLGWIHQQITDDLTQGFAGHLDQLTDRARSHTFTTQRVRSSETTAAGMVHDTPRTWWNGETEAVWMDGLLRMAFLTDHPEGQRKAKQWVQALLDSQDPDGYLGIYQPDSRYQHRQENGELWTQSRALLVLLAHHEFTGNPQSLHAAQRAADLTLQHYGPHHSYFDNTSPAGGTGHGLMFADAARWLHQLTGNPAYRDFAVWLYRDYSNIDRLRDTDNQRHRLLDPDLGFHWHAPHTTEHLRVPLWVAAFTQDPQDQAAARGALTKIKKYLTPSGACIGDENIEDRPGSADLPYEYCAITELLTSLQTALQLTADPTFADRTEWLAFNAAQAARSPDGKAISYLTRDNRNRLDPHECHGRMKYSPTHQDVAVCCNPNATKLLPYYLQHTWLHQPGTPTEPATLHALCYAPCTLDTEIAGTRIAIKQTAPYPFTDTLHFEVVAKRPVRFRLRLRIPGWATDWHLAGLDSPTDAEPHAITLDRTWHTPQSFTLHFTCPPILNPAANDQHTVSRGPLLYARQIPESRTTLRTYDTPGFTDFAAEPTDPDQPHTLHPDPATLTPTDNPEADLNRPWHQSPISLQATLQLHNGPPTSHALLPIGCTLLRQATFATTHPADPG